MAWYMTWPGILYGIVCMASYMVRPGGHLIWHMVWPSGHGMVCLHGIWYGLASMAWNMTWSCGHSMVYGMVYGMAWRAWHGMVYGMA